MIMFTNFQRQYVWLTLIYVEIQVKIVLVTRDNPVVKNAIIQTTSGVSVSIKY